MPPPEDTPTLPTTSDADPPEDTDEPHRPKIRIPITLFLLTCASTYYVGGLSYALAIMTILVCHESGHFLQARRYGVHASLPYFLPVPIPPIGTFGAVIAMEAGKGDRRALFDIGITGPIAGLIPTLVACYIGVANAEIVSKAANRFALELGEPLILQWMIQLKHGVIPDHMTVVIGPIGMAGWVGLLITSLNLIPVGQLDGGHVLYALLRRRAHYVAQAVLLIALVALVFFPALKNWTLMLFLLILVGPYHPPTADDNARLGPVRVILGWLILAFVIIGFTPTPFILPMQ